MDLGGRYERTFSLLVDAGEWPGSRVSPDLSQGAVQAAVRAALDQVCHSVLCRVLSRMTVRCPGSFSPLGNVRVLCRVLSRSSETFSQLGVLRVLFWVLAVLGCCPGC